MAKNQAIVIGINKYNPNNLTPLNYAKNDAESVRDFFEKEVGFENVYFFSDDSPDITSIPGKNIPSQPTLGNLVSFLSDRFEKPFMKAGDNFWFFFAGHGLRHNERDYLMPCDGNPRNVEWTAIPVSYVTERLRRCGADNVILILDACRNLGGRGLGIGGEQQQGVITIFSCSPSETSYEIEGLKQGAFTHVMLEALRIQGEGNCATVERLYQHLSYRVPELNSRYNKPGQTPYIIAEPATKLHLILLPKYATVKDIETLKKDAWKAEAYGEFELAKQLWIRVNIAASGSDIEAIEAFPRIAHKVGQTTALKTSFSNGDDGGISSDISIQLLSAVGMDYTNLQNLLAAGKWKEGDEETARIMLKVAKREKEGWLREEDLEKFPCEDLRTIDQIWVKYSDGLFGFSVQKGIWESVGGKPSHWDYEIYKLYGERVGWYEKEKGDMGWTSSSALSSFLRHLEIIWTSKSQLTLTEKNALKGYLPAWGWWHWNGCERMISLFSRVENCNL